VPDARRYYIVVTGPANWEKTAALGWKLLGMKSTRRRMANGFRPGDRIVAYYTGLKQFGAIVAVTSDPFEDHEPIWGSPDKPNEDYPYRVQTDPELVLMPQQRIDAAAMAARMAYTKRWPPQNWTLGFQGNIHEISATDFELVRDEMAGAIAAGRA